MRTTLEQRRDALAHIGPLDHPWSWTELRRFITDLCQDCDDAETSAADTERATSALCKVIDYTPPVDDATAHRIRSCAALLLNQRHRDRLPTGTSPDASVAILQAEVEQLRRDCALYKADAEKYAAERDEALKSAIAAEKGWEAASEHAENREAEINRLDVERASQVNDAANAELDRLREEVRFAAGMIKTFSNGVTSLKAERDATIAERDRLRTEREDFGSKMLADYKEVCALSRNFQAERDAALASKAEAEKGWASECARANRLSDLLESASEYVMNQDLKAAIKAALLDPSNDTPA